MGITKSAGLILVRVLPPVSNLQLWSYSTPPYPDLFWTGSYHTPPLPDFKGQDGLSWTILMMRSVNTKVNTRWIVSDDSPDVECEHKGHHQMDCLG
jgi:hypothetical protein